MHQCTRQGPSPDPPPGRGTGGLAADADLEMIGSRSAGDFCHPAEEIVTQVADLRGPCRMINGHHQGICVDPDGLDVAGHGRPDDILPPGEQPADSHGAPEAQLCG